MSNYGAVEYRDGLGRTFWQPHVRGVRLWLYPTPYSIERVWSVDTYYGHPKLYRSLKRALRVAKREERRRHKRTLQQVRETGETND